MDFDIPPVGGFERPGATPRSAPSSDAGSAGSLEAATNGRGVPASPPAAVLDQMDQAARAYDDLRAQNRELHFEPAGGGRVDVQLRDLEGNVVSTVAPAMALEIAAGAPLG